MKIKSILTIFISLILLSTAAIISSCKNSIFNIEQITDIGGAGSFYVINVSANDTIEPSTGLNGGLYYPTLNAKNGEEVKLVFVPSDKYGKYTFNVTYILPDSTKIVGTGKEFTHVFTLEGFEVGRYNISMSASSTEQVITSFGNVIIKITE